MSEGAEQVNLFTYQDKLTLGAREVSYPGLVSVPSLEATLQLHRAYQERMVRDVDQDFDGNVTHDHTSVAWGSSNEEMSYALLTAAAIVKEIEKGLDQLGIDWKPALNGTFLPQMSEDSALISCPPQYAVPEAQFDPLIGQAVELVCAFHSLGDGWIVEETHAYGERCVDEEEGIYITTLDEWDVNCPDIPSVDGLPDWNELTAELEDEGYYFDDGALIEGCTAVLVGIANRILEAENQA